MGKGERPICPGCGAFLILALPPGGRFDLKLVTESGRAENQYGAPLNIENDGRVATITGGQGGPQLRLTTERGQVTVRKSTDQSGTDGGSNPPIPPHPPSQI